MSEQQLDRQASRLSLREQLGSRLQSFRASRGRERKRSQDEAVSLPKGPEVMSPRSREGVLELQNICNYQLTASGSHGHVLAFGQAVQVLRNSYVNEPSCSWKGFVGIREGLSEQRTHIHGSL